MRGSRKLALAGLGLAAVLVAAAKKPGVVVRAPKSVPDVDDSIGETLGELFAEGLQGSDAFGSLVTERDIAAMLRAERSRQMLGCEEGSSCLAEMAGAIGAEFLSLLDVSKLGDSMVIGARLIEMQGAKVLFRRTRTFKNLDAAGEIVRELAMGAAAAARQTRSGAVVAMLPPGTPLPAGDHSPHPRAAAIANDAVTGGNVAEETDLARRAQAAVAHRDDAMRLRAAAEQASAQTESERAKKLAEYTPDMALVPEGEFFVGCNSQSDNECLDNERPGRRVFLPAFKIDMHEVALKDYEQCVDAEACSAADEEGYGCVYGTWFRGDRPVNCVDWKQARAYCQWKGRRLPTAREWEKAARGPDGRVFPWGNEPGQEPPAAVAPLVEDLLPVGSNAKGASPYGVLDMAGNVAEWTGSTYDERRFEYRGGGYMSPIKYARASDRHRAEIGTRKPDLGFRCAL